MSYKNLGSYQLLHASPCACLNFKVRKSSINSVQSYTYLMSHIVGPNYTIFKYRAYTHLFDRIEDSLHNCSKGFTLSFRSMDSSAAPAR